MRILYSAILFLVLLGVFSAPKAKAQIVTIPIPGSPLSLNVMANPQPLQNINKNPEATQYQLWDDGYANVALPFNFPFFNQSFNNSTMYSNGAVQFGPPVVGFPSNNTFCCSGITIDRNTPPAYNYSILMMQDDLYGSTGHNHYTLGTSNTMTYGWYNVERLGQPQTKTNFELKIDSSGNIDMRWTGALLSYNSPAIGVIGDASKGEFAVLQQGSLATNTFSIPGLTQWTTGYDPCTTNPLYAPSCPGYAAAYTEQQCSINPLYSVTCSGYQQAYHNQQCSINPLSYTDCPGYEQAYLNAQCIQDSLYSRLCTGFATAYAIKYLVSLDSSTSAAVNSSLSATAAIRASDPISTNINGVVSTTGDATVDSIIASPNSTSVTSPTNLITAPPSPAGVLAPAARGPEQAPPSPAMQQARTADAKKTDTAVASIEKKAGGNATAAKAAATEAAKELAKKASEAATLEAQVANQGLVVGLMSFVPGFSAYQNAIVPDVLGAQVARQYNKPTVDNRSAQRQLSGGNELRWKEMVDSQYKK